MIIILIIITHLFCSLANFMSGDQVTALALCVSAVQSTIAQTQKVVQKSLKQQFAIKLCGFNFNTLLL